MALVCILLILSFVGVKEEVQAPGPGESASRLVQYRETTDGKIVRIERGESGFLDTGSAKQAAETVYVQIDDDTNSYARYCAISGDGRYIFVNWMLNYERASLYPSALDPGVTPYWEYSADYEFQGQVGISFDGGTMAAGELSEGYQWNKSSSTPLSTYDLGTSEMVESYTSRDGSKVFYLNHDYDSGNGKISAFDSDTYVSLWEFEFGGYPHGIDCTPHGDTVAVSTYDSVYVFTASGQLGQALPVDGWQYTPGISANGERVVTGDYDGDMRIYQWNGVAYVQIYSHHVPSSGGYISWVVAVDISDDGRVVLMGTYCFGDEDNYAACFKDDGGFGLEWKSISPYHGGIQSCRLSADGSKGIVGCIGKSTTAPAGDVLCVYDTSDSTSFLNITNNEERGSITWVDMDTAGEWACASGKAVNVHDMGRGGQVYCIHVGEKVLKDIAVQKIISPPESLEIGDYTPRARYVNLGSDTIDTFVAHFEIYDSLNALVYGDSSEQYNLPPIWVRDVTFSNWSCSAYGWYEVITYACADGDQYSGNDTLMLYSYCDGAAAIEESETPVSFHVLPPYPNPVKNSLGVFYALPERADITVRVYDVTGRMAAEVVRRDQQAGHHQLRLDTSDSPAGVYFVNVSCGKESHTAKFVVVK